MYSNVQYCAAQNLYTAIVVATSHDTRIILIHHARRARVGTAERVTSHQKKAKKKTRNKCVMGCPYLISVWKAFCVSRTNASDPGFPFRSSTPNVETTSTPVFPSLSLYTCHSIQQQHMDMVWTVYSTELSCTVRYGDSPATRPAWGEQSSHPLSPSHAHIGPFTQYSTQQ